MIKIGKEDILAFLIAFFAAFIIFKNTPSIEYPVLHINPYQKPKTQNQYEENISTRTLYAPKYLFVTNLFNLPPPPPPTLPPLAQAIFVSNAVKLSGIFERGKMRFAVLTLPNGSMIKVHQGQLIPADMGGAPQGPQGFHPGGMPGLPSLPQLLGMHPSPSPPNFPQANAKISKIPKEKGPFIKVTAVGPNYVSFSFVQKIPKQKGALTTYKYKFYKKTIRIFNFEVKNYER
ncbi:MAG: hypothetical protein ACP5S8_00680 [Hydrogenobaculum sp.]